MDGRPLRSKSFNCPATFLVSTLFYFVNKQISDEEFCRMEMNSPHPWSAQRWFLEIIHRELIKGWPKAPEDVLWAMCSEVGLKKWKKISADDKKRFIQCEDLDKKKESEKKPTPKKGKKEKRDPNKPKQGMTAFFLFMNKKRERCMAANPDFSVTEVAKELSRQWKEMSEEMKAPYMLQQEKDKIRFAKEMESYNQQEKEKIRLTKMMDAAPQAEL